MAAGDSGCEAYTAIAWGVGLSHERSDIAGAEGFYSLPPTSMLAGLAGARPVHPILRRGPCGTRSRFYGQAGICRRCKSQIIPNHDVPASAGTVN